MLEYPFRSKKSKDLGISSTYRIVACPIVLFGGAGKIASEGRGREFESRRVRHQVLDIVGKQHLQLRTACTAMRSLGQNVAGTRKEIGHVSDTSVATRSS